MIKETKRKVSCIIPTYNRSSTLATTLPSYIKNDDINEIIIVDDGSTDDTHEILSELAKKIDANGKTKIIRLTKNVGLPEARNIGIRNSKYSYIVFGEDDVEFDRNYIRNLFLVMKNTGADIVGGRQIFVRQGETRLAASKKADKLTQNDLYIQYPTDVNFSVRLERSIEMHTMFALALIKKEIFTKKHVWYDSKKFTGNYHREETDFYTTAFKKGAKIVFANNAFVWHLQNIGINGGCRSHNRLFIEWSLLRNNYVFWKKHYNFLKGKLDLQHGFWYYVFSYSLNRYIKLIRKHVI